MLVHNIETSPEMNMSNISNVQSIDLNQLDKIEEPDNIFASASSSFLGMIQSMHNDQSSLLNSVSEPTQLSPVSLIKTQMLMEDYQNSIGMTSTIIKQINKSIDSLTHIQ